MNYLSNYRVLLTYEGIVFTLIFTLLFGVTNLIMIDYDNMQAIITSETPFFIIIFFAILVYLIKNSKVTFNKTKIAFYIIWLLFALSLILSPAAAGNFSWTGVVVLILISLIILFKIPVELVLFVLLGALISSLILLFADASVNGASVSMVLILIAGLMLIPKTNQAFLFYLLPSIVLIFTMSADSTVLITFTVIFTVQLIIINFSSVFKNYNNLLIIGLTGLILLISIPLYQNITGQQNTDPIFNMILENYGIITLVLFFTLIAFTTALAIPFDALTNISLYIISMIIIIIFKPEYFLIDTVITPVVVLIVLLSVFLSNERKHDYMF